MNIFFFNAATLRKRLKSFLCVWVAAMLIVFSGTEAFASGHWEEHHIETDLGEYIFRSEIDMWHYSGGYWKIGAGDDISMQLTDAQLDGACGVTDYITSEVELKYVIDVPEKLKYCLGKDWQVHVDLSKEFYDTYDLSSALCYISGGKIYLNAKPILKLSRHSFDDYVSNLLVSLPLVNYPYGMNLYAVWKGSAEMGRGYGYYDDSSIYTTGYGYIHPLMIKDYTGKFYTGYSINYNQNIYPSDEYSIGYGTFRNGGALGLDFFYAFYADVWAETDESVWVDDGEPYVPPIVPDEPVVPGGPDNPGTTPGAIDPSAGGQDWIIHRVR